MHVYVIGHVICTTSTTTAATSAATSREVLLYTGSSTQRAESWGREIDVERTVLHLWRPPRRRTKHWVVPWPFEHVIDPGEAPAPPPAPRSSRWSAQLRAFAGR